MRNTICVTFLLVVGAVLVGWSAAVEELSAQEETCCPCSNSSLEPKHYFLGGPHCQNCVTNPHQCQDCEEIEEEEEMDGGGGCHAQYSDPELELLCADHPDCGASEEDRDAVELLTASLESGSGWEAISLLEAGLQSDRIVLNRSRTAIQILSCSGVGFIGHYPVSREVLVAAAAAQVADAPIILDRPIPEGLF